MGAKAEAELRFQRASGDRVVADLGGTAANTTPTELEWLKFLAGCFSRRIDKSVFVTTGRLTSEQRREAGEANVLVVEGQEEVARIASLHGIVQFDLFEGAEESDEAEEE